MRSSLCDRLETEAVLRPWFRDARWRSLLNRRDWHSLLNRRTLSIGQGESRDQLDRHPEVACLQQALASGTCAELRIESPTVEGDPVTEYYRVTREGTTEVYVDSTQDDFSDQTWSYSDCREPESALDANC